MQVIHVGPLQEEGVVGMNELGVLVRETALSAYKGLKRSLADYSHPYIATFSVCPISLSATDDVLLPVRAQTRYLGSRCERE
jgi:hypothetical protein